MIPDITGWLGLTLLNPWAAAVAWHGKRVENRGWAPPRTLRGVLIHAGKGWDEGAVQTLQAQGYDTIRRSVVPSAVVAVATLGRVCEASLPGGPGGCDCGEWAAHGQRHWNLAEVWTLPMPVPCPGRQQLWAPHPAVAKQVQASLNAGVGAPLVCRGRKYDPSTGRPVDGAEGRLCGARFLPAPGELGVHYEQRARVAGWRIEQQPRDPNNRGVICPLCAAPDPKTSALCNDLTRSVRR